MEMANCKRCKKLFPRVNEPICEACKKAEEELFLNVKEFLRENSKSTVMEISQATGASHKRITDWLREGRLELSAEASELNCRGCGKRITSGNYCDACLIQVNQDIDTMFSKGGKTHGSFSGELRAGAMHTRNPRK